MRRPFGHEPVFSSVVRPCCSTRVLVRLGVIATYGNPHLFEAYFPLFPRHQNRVGKILMQTNSEDPRAFRSMGNRNGNLLPGTVLEPVARLWIVMSNDGGARTIDRVGKYKGSALAANPNDYGHT